MYRKLTSSMTFPQWAGTADKPGRWRCFDQLDRLLSGTFYDHLGHSFYDERRNERLIPLEERRPSSRYNLAWLVSKWSSRKLFAGRHIPRISHKNSGITEMVSQIIQTTKFFDVMMTSVIVGSVGSVAITFKVDTTQDEPQVGFRVWRARDCIPTFDDFGNLSKLVVAYAVSGSELLRQSFTVDSRGESLSRHQQYWWMRDFLPDGEITYVPIRVDDWNPVDGPKDNIPLKVYTAIEHDLQFVPGVWIRNMAGCPDPTDGVGTWEKAKDNAIEIDYLLSQISRGTRYNCSPQLVITGTITGSDDEESERSPASVLMLAPGVKDADGLTTGESKAELLEMSGNGVKAALEQVDKLRNMSLEMIGATRKDPEKLKGVMSGRAMEFMDEDSHDLIMELRSSYGAGALELMRKVLRGVGSEDPKGLKLDWPRLYQPTPEDLAHLIPALVLAVTPVQEPLEPEEAAKISGGSDGVTASESTKDGGGGGDGGQQEKKARTTTHKSATGSSHTVKEEVTKGPGTAGGRPSVTPTGGKIIGSLLEMEEASDFLKLYMDINLLPGAEESGVTDSDQPLPTLPPPLPDKEVPEEGDGDKNLLHIPASP